MLKRKRKSNTTIFLAIVVLAFSATILAKAYIMNKALSGFTNNTIELDGIDLKYEPNPTLYFFKGCNGIRMGVTNDQAFSIREAITKDMFNRPLTHDLVFEILNSYKIRLIYAKIDDIKDGIYTSKLLLSDGTTLHEADSRPSDMAAFTLRYGNKFAISNSLISNMTNVCQ